MAAHDPEHGQGGGDGAHELGVADLGPVLHGGPQVVDLRVQENHPLLLRLAGAEALVDVLSQVAEPRGVALSDRAILVRGSKALAGELADRLEHREARLSGIVGALDQRAIHQPLEDVDVRLPDRFCCLERPAAGEDAQAPEEGLLRLGQELVAPLHRGAQRSLSWIRVAAAREEVQALGESLQDLLDRQDRQPRRGKVQRQGQPVEALRQPRERRRWTDRHAERDGPRHEQLLGIGLCHDRHPDEPLGLEAQRLAARDQQGGAACIGHQLRHRLGQARQEVLGVVQDQQSREAGAR